MISCTEKKSNDFHKVVVGYQPTVFYSYLFLAKELGYFKEANLEVELIEFSSANKMFQAYLAGQIDITGLTATEIMLRGLGKNPGSFICPLYVELNDKEIADRIIVLKNSNIRNIADLKGKKIGSHPGTTVPNILIKFLLKYGIQENEYEIQTLNANLQVDAVLNKAVDAIICLEPTGTRLLQTGECKILYSHPFEIINARVPASFSVVSKEFINKKPDTYNNYITTIKKAILEYNRMVKNNRSRLNRILSEKLNVEIDFLKSLNSVVYRLPEEWNYEDLDIVLEFYNSIGIKPGKINFTELQGK